MVDSGAASSHIISACVDAIQIKRIKRDNPLQIIGFGNKRSELIFHYSPIKLTGRDGQCITVNFNVFNKDIISKLPGVSSSLIDEYPHVKEHKDQLSAPIPRNPQTVHAILGVRDVVKIYATSKPLDACPDICLMYRVDSMGDIWRHDNP